jgi:O-methyltransferase
MDWPLHGLTMVGLRRLDDLQACVETVVADGVEGDLIEAGAWRGGASILMRATLDTLGDDRTVWVADSFEGFAGEDADADDVALSSFDFLAAPADEVRESFERFGCDRGVELVRGYFEDTLPSLRGRHWAIIRLDADTYEATKQALGCLYPGLATGGYLIIDDYASFEGCRRAVDEFRAEHGIAEPLEQVDFTCARWRRTSDAGSAIAAPAPRAVTQREPRARRPGHVPTAQELDLVREVAELRGRLEAAETALASGLRVRARSALRSLVKR